MGHLKWRIPFNIWNDQISEKNFCNYLYLKDSDDFKRFVEYFKSDFQPSKKPFLKLSAQIIMK